MRSIRGESELRLMPVGYEVCLSELNEGCDPILRPCNTKPGTCPGPIEAMGAFCLTARKGAAGGVLAYFESE